MQKLSSQIVADVVRPRPADSFKGTFGKVTLVGGNENFGGAIIMATMAAVYSGAGLVTTCTAPLNAGPLHAQVPEAMFADMHDDHQVARLVSAATTVVVGPGLGDDEQSTHTLHVVLDNVSDHQTVVIDGSAITIMARDHLDLPAGKVVFTPHQMEWQRLSGIKIADQEPALNQDKVKELGATVVLKSHRTAIYDGTDIYQLPIGTPAQAVGGMGDTLAGMVGGFTAQFHNQGVKAVLAAVYAHSDVAEQIADQQYIVLPHQISRALPAYMKRMSSLDRQHQIGFNN